MKKFLTVLLALSVVFTYSFSAVGSVFAAEDPVVSAQKMVLAKADAVMADPATTNYEAKAVEYAIAEAKTAGFNAINVLVKVHTDTNGILNETTFINAVRDWCNNANGDVTDPTDSNKTYPDFMEVYTTKAAEKDFEIKVSNAKTFVENIKPEDYIEKDRATVAAYKKAVMDALDALVKEGVSSTGYTVYYPFGYMKDGSIQQLASNFDQNITYTQLINSYLYGRSGATNYFTADNTIKEIKAGMTADYSIRGLVLALDELTTLAEDAENSQVTDAYIENIIANITYNAKAASDGFYAKHKVEAGDSVTQNTGYVTLADGITKVYDVKVANATKITAAEATAINNALMAQINDMLTVVETYVKDIPNHHTSNADIKADLDKQVPWYAQANNFAPAMDWALKAIDKYEEVVAYGADMKDDVNYIGEKMYDDADIDAAIADAKAEIYWNYFDAKYSANAGSYFTGIAPIHDPVDVALKAAKAKWGKLTTDTPKPADADKKYCADYYAGYNGKNVAPTSVNWQDEYADIRDEAIAALDEVKTVAEVEAIMAEADAKLAKLRTAADDNAALSTEINKYVAALDKYANEQWELVKPGNLYRADSYTDKANNDVTSAYEDGKDTIEGVATVGELAAAYEEAKALFKDIKTDAELKAEAKAVNEAVAALPAKVTLENEKAYMDANDALDAYLANYGAKNADVVGAYYALDKAMDTLKALQEDAVEEAIRELAKLAPIKADDKEAVQKVRDLYDGYYDYYGNSFTVSNLRDLTNAEEAVYYDEIAVVKDMISKLTTASSIKDILAAKEAYDALSGSQQRKIAKAYPYKVAMLNDRIIESVESLKIKTSTKLYKGSKIRVKWTVNGDASAIDGYQVYKSTKAQKNYKFMGKTKKSYMDNKKGLKKGTRYFYKVRAFVEIDGQKYYSDWSNKGNRIYKK